MKHIWVMDHSRVTFWKEHGKSSWSRNIKDLVSFIGLDYEVKYCDNDNQTYGKWEDRSSNAQKTTEEKNEKS